MADKPKPKPKPKPKKRERTEMCIHRLPPTTHCSRCDRWSQLALGSIVGAGGVTLGILAVSAARSTWLEKQ